MPNVPPHTTPILRFVSTSRLEPDFTAGELQGRLTGHNGPIFSLKWSPNGRLLVTSGVDCACIVWEARSGTSVQTYSVHSGAIFSSQIRSPASSRTCCGSMLSLAVGLRCFNARCRAPRSSPPSHLRVPVLPFCDTLLPTLPPAALVGLLMRSPVRRCRLAIQRLLRFVLHRPQDICVQTGRGQAHSHIPGAHGRRERHPLGQQGHASGILLGRLHSAGACLCMH